MQKRTKLQRHFDLFRTTRHFPLDCEDDELSVLHAELVDLDMYNAGLIVGLLEEKPHPTLRPMTDPFLRERLERIVTSDNLDRAKLAREYLDYMQELEKLVGLADAVLKNDLQ